MAARIRPEVVISYNPDGTAVTRRLTQEDRDALFDQMFHELPQEHVGWEIEALEDGSTRIKLSRMPRSKANVPVLEISGAWYDLVDALRKYVVRYRALNPDPMAAQQELPL